MHKAHFYSVLAGRQGGGVLGSVTRVVNSYHFKADPDSSFLFYTDPDLTFHCNADPPDLAPHQDDAILQPLVCRVADPLRLHIEPPKLLNFDLNADPDPAFHSNADPDPASQN